MRRWVVRPGDPGYPSRVAACAAYSLPPALEFLGAGRVSYRVAIGLLCSVSCPGSAIIRTYDAIRALRDAGAVVAGGFHSPMEAECLDYLIRGQQAVVMCVAVGLKHVAPGPEAVRAIDDGRLSVVSLFDDHVERATPWHGSRRNDLVAAIAEILFVPYAAPGGMVETNGLHALARGQPVLTLAAAPNARLVKAGAQVVSVSEIVSAAVAAGAEVPSTDGGVSSCRPTLPR